MNPTVQQRERYEVVARKALAVQPSPDENRQEFLQGVLFTLSAMANHENILPSSVIPDELVHLTKMF